MRLSRSLPPILVLASAWLGAAAADPLRFYDHQSSHGAWAVHCEGLDDMGGITLTDCAIVSEEGVILFVTQSTPQIGRTADSPVVALLVEGQELAFDTCPNKLCALPFALQTLTAATEPPLVISALATWPLPSSGLAEALAEARRLVN